ncbi:MAG: C40 family peptidase [Betaproteobacteria bacterium]|nr:C40 family peptidase [Betaproteobacteria bacterium]
MLPSFSLPRRRAVLAAAAAGFLLAACGSSPSRKEPKTAKKRSVPDLPPTERGREVVLYALGLLETGYRFGGKNPEAGFDCSGMVAYVYSNAIGLLVGGSAADIARRGKSVGRDGLRPGDLVFFNTLNRSFSHVGIYIGEDRFIHAPSTNGSVRIDEMGSDYYASRFEAARSYFD